MDVYSGPRKHQCAKIKPAFMLVSKTTHKQHSIGEIHTDTRGGDWSWKADIHQEKWAKVFGAAVQRLYHHKYNQVCSLKGCALELPL